MERKMFYNAGPLLFARAKELRNHLTHAEMVLWGYLKTKPFGYKFRRQHPLADYIVDFFCYRLKMAIEVDGPIHEQEENRQNDVERQKMIESFGVTVLRFTNAELMKESTIVFEEINSSIQHIINNLKKEDVHTPPLGGWGV